MKIKKLITLLLLVLFVNKFVYSIEGYDPRINFLPYHERVKALDRYWQMRQWQDRMELYKERHGLKILEDEKKLNAELKSLAERDPELYEKRLRYYGQKLEEMRRANPLPAFIPISEQEKFWGDILSGAREFYKIADDVRKWAEEKKKEIENSFWQNFGIKTAVTAVIIVGSIALTALTGGGAAPVAAMAIKSAVASWAVDAVHTGYLTYNAQNRDSYDVLRWVRSEEFKFSYSVSATAKIATSYVVGGNPLSFGDGSGSFNVGDIYYAANSVTTLASIGAPYYNEDTNKALTYTQSALSIWGGIRTLKEVGPEYQVYGNEGLGKTVKDFKTVAGEIDKLSSLQNNQVGNTNISLSGDGGVKTNFVSLYNSAERWYKAAEITKNVYGIMNIASGLYTAYIVSNPSALNEDSRRWVDSSLTVTENLAKTYSQGMVMKSLHELDLAAQKNLKEIENIGGHVGVVEVLDEGKFAALRFYTPTGAFNKFEGSHNKSNNGQFQGKDLIMSKDFNKDYLAVRLNAAYMVLQAVANQTIEGQKGYITLAHVNSIKEKFEKGGLDSFKLLQLKSGEDPAWVEHKDDGSRPDVYFYSQKLLGFNIQDKAFGLIDRDKQTIYWNKTFNINSVSNLSTLNVQLPSMK